GLREHVGLCRRHACVLLDPRASRPRTPGRCRLPRAARRGAPAHARRGGRHRGRPRLPPSSPRLPRRRRTVTTTTLPRLSAATAERAARPVTVLQFGGGNFLRAFVDQMIHAANQTGVMNAGVAVV